MDYTNKFNWAPELVEAIVKDRYHDSEEDPFDYSASSLVAPVQLTLLKQRHPDKLMVEDVSQMFWRFMGSIAHNVLEEAFHAQDNGDGSFVEKRLYMEVFGKKVSGKMDLYSASRQEVRDYKSTKVYKIIKGDYDEWEKAQNIYARLLNVNGYPVKRLTIIPLIFDWKEAECFKKNYPSSASGQINLKLWSPERQQTYIETRIEALNNAEKVSDEQLAHKFPCSEAEMWQDLKDWAIFKRGADRATAANFDTEAEARAAFEQKKLSYSTHQVIKRMSGRTRCQRFCPVRHICFQNRQLSLQEGNPLPADQQPCIF